MALQLDWLLLRRAEILAVSGASTERMDVEPIQNNTRITFSDEEPLSDEEDEPKSAEGVSAVDEIEDELLDRAKLKMLTDRTVRHAHAKEKRKKVGSTKKRREDDEPRPPVPLNQTT